MEEQKLSMDSVPAKKQGKKVDKPSSAVSGDKEEGELSSDNEPA